MCDPIAFMNYSNNMKLFPHKWVGPLLSGRNSKGVGESYAFKLHSIQLLLKLLQYNIEKKPGEEEEEDDDDDDDFGGSKKEPVADDPVSRE